MKGSVYSGDPMPTSSMFVEHVREDLITYRVSTQGFRLSGTLLEDVLGKPYPGNLTHA